MEQRFQASMLQKIIELESNDVRFEGFCRRVVSIIEGGAPVLPTSKSWDLGRDGVGAGNAKGIYVCCSLRDDVDNKAISDIERLVSTTDKIGFIYFCSSKSLSEHRISQIEVALRETVDFAVPIICLGGLQLSAALEQEPEVARSFYGAELDDCYRTVMSEPGDDVEGTGLRLALMAMSGEDSNSIRKEVYSSSILDLLSQNESGISLKSCAVKISSRLKLGHALAEGVLQPHILEMERQGLLTKSGQIIYITKEGRENLQKSEVAAGERLIVGKNDVREALEDSIGAKFVDAHFERIWSVFEDRMTFYFASKGHAVVSEIHALLFGDAEYISDKPAQLSFLDDFALAVSATSALESQRDELYQAVKDLFSDRTSKATNWLVKLAASYMAACALGLEYNCGKALSKLFARTHLIIDTDVVLSLLCIGEPEHEAVSSIVNRWVQNNGKILVAEPVLEEVAHHAHIAKRDYEETRHLLPGTPEERLHLIENAFVRSFAELLARREARPSEWSQYIRQYKGGDKSDWVTVFGLLAAEYSIEKLPPRSVAEETLEMNVRRYLVAQAEARINNGNLYIAKDKARRDAELYSSLVHYMRLLKRVDPGSTCLLVSSAHRLMSAESKFHETGESQLVVSIATILYLLSMLPSVSLGLNAMKVFLFDERRSGFSSELERTLLRMIKTSKEVSMPFARRGLLMRHVRDRMIQDARREGSYEDIGVIERAALKEENKQTTIKILADSLDALAIDSRLEVENRKLRQEIEQLKRKVEEGRNKRANK